MEKWKELHWPQNNWCANAEEYIRATQSTTRKLGIGDIQGALFLLCSGLFIAFGAFAAEFFFHSSAEATKNFKEELLSRRKEKPIPWTYMK